MALKRYLCNICGETKEAFKGVPEHCGKPMELQLAAPNTKLVETIDAATNKKRIIGLPKILMERAKAHMRDHEADDLIQGNRNNDVLNSTLINKKGTRKLKIEDK